MKKRLLKVAPMLGGSALVLFGAQPTFGSTFHVSSDEEMPVQIDTNDVDVNKIRSAPSFGSKAVAFSGLKRTNDLSQEIQADFNSYQASIDRYRKGVQSGDTQSSDDWIEFEFGDVEPALTEAARSNQIHIVLHIFSTHKANLKESHILSAFKVAMYQEHLDIVKTFLAKVQEDTKLTTKEMLNYLDSEGKTPLIWAVEHGKKEITKFLIDHSETNVNANDVHGRTALKAAIANRDEAAIQLLFSRPDLDANAYNKTSHHKGETALSFAIRQKNPQFVEALLNHPQVSVNALNENGTTPLDIAIQTEEMGTLKAILNCQDLLLNLNQRNNWSEYQKTSFLLMFDLFEEELKQQRPCQSRKRRYGYTLWIVDEYSQTVLVFFYEKNRKGLMRRAHHG